jgi:hypothetical protein
MAKISEGIDEPPNMNGGNSAEITITWKFNRPSDESDALRQEELVRKGAGIQGEYVFVQGIIRYLYALLLHAF